jgi:L-rhamnose mutarotase
MNRYGMVLRLRDEKVDDYVRLHAAVWPEVITTIERCNVRNYSIFMRRLDDGRHYLFSYFEYVGADFAADMARMAADAATQRWWAQCEPCQEPLETRASGEWWANMNEVFHHD